MADATEIHAAETHATTEAHGGSAHEVSPSVFGMDSTGWVSLAMAVFFAILLWKKVPAVIGGALDKSIGAIKAQLDEASRLRAEAEALRSEYEARLASVAKDAVALRERAEDEARILLREAQENATALVARRMKMAEDKIAAAERAAVADIRARAVSAATSAAVTLIARNHDAKADKPLIDESIKALGSIN